MTTSTDMFLETVSLNDDTPNGQVRANGNGSADDLEAQLPSLNGTKSAKNGDASNPIVESDDKEDDDTQREQIVVVVDPNRKPVANGRPVHPTLPLLRVPKQEEEEEYFRDYDPTLFSPEVSRRAVEIARSRAKTLEMELQELALLEVEKTVPAAKMSPGEAVGIISSAFVTSISKVKQLVTSGEKEYDLLSGSSPLSKLDDLDTDGDGLQISPDASKGEGKHFQFKHKPALKRISAYSSLDKDKRVNSNNQKQKKRIVWHEEVLDQDEEFYDDEEPHEETESLMEVNGKPILNYKNDRLTPRSKKKRKKLVKGMMRRLTPMEKEELYKQRPDLMIIPNWAQKYRQGLEDEESSRWSFWLISIIGTLAVLLIVLIILIAKERAATVKS
uniref:Uncharacterized protein n=1 Tax=Globisporangium ultimum (strain ATCC 200006 / CBS 805.95 / DAOM BR144) TaxID=431595 RepID=K3WSD9_GLOUD